MTPLSIGLTRHKKKTPRQSMLGVTSFSLSLTLFSILAICLSKGAGHTARVGASMRDNVQPDAEFHAGERGLACRQSSTTMIISTPARFSHGGEILMVTKSTVITAIVFFARNRIMNANAGSPFQFF
jgi:hypothetical protein